MPPSTDARDRRETLRRELESLRDLPTPSRIVHEIWNVLDDRRASASTLAVVLARDTSLSARTLRLANSAYFGLPQPVADVRAACVVLGFEMVRGLAVSVAALDGLSGPAGRVLDIDAFWGHSVAVATAGRALARRLGIPDTGTAFCGGMLHDLGRLVLAVVEPARYRRFLASGGDPADRERERSEFGAGHDEVGAWLAGRWRLPDVLLDAIGGHHGAAVERPAWVGARAASPARPPAPDLPDGPAWTRWGALVHVADVIARRHGYPCLPQPAAEASPAAAPSEAGPRPDETALRLLGLGPEALRSVESAYLADVGGIPSLAVAAGGRP